MEAPSIAAGLHGQRDRKPGTERQGLGAPTHAFSFNILRLILIPPISLAHHFYTVSSKVNHCGDWSYFWEQIAEKAQTSLALWPVCLLLSPSSPKLWFVYYLLYVYKVTYDAHSFLEHLRCLFPVTSSVESPGLNCPNTELDFVLVLTGIRVQYEKESG